MTAEIRYLRALRTHRKEQEKEQRAREEERAPKIGRSARVRLFHWLPAILGVIPRIKFNPNALRRGQIIGEKKNDDGMEYTVRFQTSQPYWDIYPEDAIKILPETK